MSFWARWTGETLVPMSARVAAARIVEDVIYGGRSLGAIMPGRNEAVSNQREQALVQELSYGVLRWRWRLEQLLSLLLRKPLRDRDRDMYCLLMVGLYQLMYMRIPPHAVVSETVSAAKSAGKNWAAGLVNAVLRSYQRDRDRLTSKIDAAPIAKFSHPSWLLDTIRRDWPEDWCHILAANNQRPPMTLRVNLRRVEREQYMDMLRAGGIESDQTAGSEAGIVLQKPTDVAALPHFFDGWASVQDAAAQLAAPLLCVAKGHRVLDACAAPGGKAGHIIELEPKLAELVAVEKDAQRMCRVVDNLQRLGVTATTVVGDAADLEDWWDGRSFDRILLDVPCSGSGVIRRHPDIKSLRRAADMSSLVTGQRRLLRQLWSALRSGGILLYTTCSIFAEENQLQIEAFLAEMEDASELKIEASWGRALSVGRQILPGEHNMDGFYYARVRKS